MPIYEYACTKCDHHFDVHHGADEKPSLNCPQCNSEVRKVFHANGIIFKGSGWHITDYAKKSSVGTESGGNGKTETTAESKETKTPAAAGSTN